MSMSVLLGIAALLVLVVLVLMFRVQGLLAVVRESDKKLGGMLNKFNASMFLVFFVLGTFLFLWYSFTRYDVYSLPISASIHGVETDNLFWVTTIIISIVFIVTHFVLFLFAYKYQYKAQNKATFYPDNHVLELVWTIIPAIVLTYLVFNGYQEWTKITNEPPATLVEDKVELEIVGKQFNWAVRYPGNDLELGGHYFKFIDADNDFGLKVSDSRSWDDFTPRKIYLPKGRPVHFVIRAKDVLHSVYAPHFRVKMDAMPGRPTGFWFTPTMTTLEMRGETGNEEFVYELACTEMCGKGHFSMRYEIVVLENDEYEKWFKQESANPWGFTNAEYVFKQLMKQGVTDQKMNEFITFIKDRDPAMAGALMALWKNGTSVEETLQRNTKPAAVDSLGNPTLMSVDTLGSSGSVMDTSGTDDGSKLRNLIHKAGDAVEGYREKKADKNGVEYKPKENGLHKLGDKVEGQ